MYRQIVIAFVLFVVLQSCGTTKESDGLTNKHPSDRITVFSILPKSETGEIISLLLVSHYENGKLTLSGFLDRVNSEFAASDFVYFDSVEQLNFDHLPFVWSAVKQDSVKRSEYVCSIGSRESVIKNHGGNPIFLSSLRAHYPRIELPEMDTNELSVQIVTSSECEIKEINDRKILQESEVFIGIVNKSEALFDRRSGLHYYWINAGLDNGESFTVFFSVDSSRKPTVLSANDYTVKLSGEKILLTNSTQELEIVIDESVKESSMYRFEAIQLTRNRQKVGTGICYIL